MKKRTVAFVSVLLAICLVVVIGFVLNSNQKPSRFFSVSAVKTDQTWHGAVGWNIRIYYLGNMPLVNVYVFVNDHLELNEAIVEKGWVRGFTTWQPMDYSVQVRIVWDGNEEPSRFM